MLDKMEIARLIPHRDNMVLLERITEWSMSHIVCTTRTHLLPDNPLRRADGLTMISGIEYGMQAMAAHGSLVDARKNRPGYLASLRDVNINVLWVHEIDEELTIRADLVLEDVNTVVYGFAITAGDRELVSGQAGVFLK